MSVLLRQSYCSGLLFQYSWQYSTVEYSRCSTSANRRCNMQSMKTCVADHKNILDYYIDSGFFSRVEDLISHPNMAKTRARDRKIPPKADLTTLPLPPPRYSCTFVVVSPPEVGNIVVEHLSIPAMIIDECPFDAYISSAVPCTLPRLY